MSAQEPQREDPEPERSAQASRAVSRWPKVKPSALRDKLYMRVGRIDDGQVVVTASDGDIGKNGAPSGLFSRLVDHVGRVIHDVGNMPTYPLVLAAARTRSITVVFGDAAIEEAQVELPYSPTAHGGSQVADLIALEGDELFERAVEVGQGIASYVELAQFVQTEGIDLEWVVAERAVRLEPARAAKQYERLNQEPEQRSRMMTIDGLLYRAIWDGPGYGRAGIKLSRYSPLPPRRRGHTVIVEYDDREIEDLVLHQLIGKPVIVQLEAFEYPTLSNILGGLPPYPRIEAIREGKRFERLDLWNDEEADELG